MNGWKKGVLALALMGMISGCIPTQRELRMERDLEEMKRRLAETEKKLVSQGRNQAGEMNGRLDALSRSQADVQAGLDGLRVEFQSLNGRFEDLSRASTDLREDLSVIRKDLGLKVTALEDRLSRLSEEVEARPAVPKTPESPEALYQQGVELIQKEGDFARGRELLTEFLNRNPRSELAVNAMYWIGEAYYGEKKYENAILQFQDVIQKYGDHPKVAAALLKQGVAFHALGDVKNARVILQKVLDSFPLSKEAEKARERLAEWK